LRKKAQRKPEGGRGVLKGAFSVSCSKPPIRKGENLRGGVAPDLRTAKGSKRWERGKKSRKNESRDGQTTTKREGRKEEKIFD